MRALRANARTPSDHPASGGCGSAFERLGLKATEVAAVTRDTAARLRGRDPRDAVRVAHALAGATSRARWSCAPGWSMTTTTW